jgi:hypothetical protein
MKFVWLVVPLSFACNTESSIKLAKQHFDPESGHTFTEDAPFVTVINLDDEPVVCVSTLGEPEWIDGECGTPLSESGTVVLPDCGFNVVNISWDGGKQSDSANYLVESPSCEDSCDPVVPWANDELARAFAVWQDETRCMMNGCDDPSGVGSWSTNCDSGSIDWDVSLDGLRAISRFTFDNCEHTVEVEAHDYDADPDGTDTVAVAAVPVTLIVDGVINQDTDFGGDGNEAGTVTIGGDFTGTVETRIVIADKTRGSGDFRAACTADPFDNEECAPGSAAIAYDFPGWSCHGDICPEAAPGDCEEPDADGDGIPDDSDNCPEVENTDQADIDQDDIGDACDDEPGFMLIQFKTSSRCLTTGSDGAVESTSICAAEDPAQQWAIFEDGSSHGFMNLGSGECLSQEGNFIGPWDVITEPCSGSEQQQWTLETYDQGGLDAQWPLRLHNVADDFCAYTDFSGWVYGTIVNCGLAGTDSNRKVGLYMDGDFETTPFTP